MSPALSQTAARPPKPWPARKPPTTARRAPYGVPASLLLHGLAVAALLFAFRGFVPPGETNMVPVDLVTIAEETNVAAAAPPQPPQETPPETIQRPPLEPMAPPPEPEIAEPAPVEVKPPEIKIAEPKPEPKRESNDINALLNQLTKPAPAPRNAARVATRAADAVGAGTAATASLADALRSAIRACWNVNPGAPNPADQIVNFELRLNRDGTIAGWALLDAPSSNSYTRAAVEAAGRAVYACQPYNMLPANRYNEWREFRLRFDPRQMQ
jgi:outer membrane biosynthesis protein TonB